MGYDVREQWSQKDFTEDVLQGMGSTRYYSVTADTLEEMADDKAVAAANGTGGQIPPYNASHPANRDLRVASKHVGPGLNERVVTVRYQYAQGGISFEPNNNPLSRAPRISWRRNEYLEPQGRDVRGNPITNSAGDPVDPPPSIPMYSRILVITRFERGYRPEVGDRFENTINDLPMFAAGRKFPAGTVLCLSIMPVGEYTDGSGIIEIEYQLEIRTRFYTAPKARETLLNKHPFAFWHLDAGLRSYFEGGGKSPGDLYLKQASASSSTGERLNEAVPLNGKGRPVNANRYLVTTSGLAPVDGALPPSLAQKIESKGGTFYMLGWEIYRRDNHLLLGL